MKTFVLTVSRTFPKTHKRSGEETGFCHKIACAVFCAGDCEECDFHKPKLHTIRGNYELWLKRAEMINKGEAVLSIRYWSDKPYRSKQVELYEISEIGVQKLNFKFNDICYPVVDNNTDSTSVFDQLHKNDGLEWEDFKEWFKGYDLSKPMAIIHFTPFRY
jgi:hypothetical protein